MIRVLHVIDSLDLGGAQTTLVNLARFRDRTKFDLTVAPMHGRGVFAEHLEEEGVRVLCLSKRKWPPAYLWNLPVAIRKGNFHIAHFHLFVSNWIAKPIAALCGLSLRINHEQCNDPARARNIFTFTVDRFSNRLSSHVLAVSASTRDYLLRNNLVAPARISCLSNCVDTSRFAPADQLSRGIARSELGIPVDSIVIAGLGRLHRQKNWPLFLNIAARFPNVSFVIAGSGPEEAFLRKEIKDGKLGNVRLLGFCDSRNILAAADIFLMTSDYEGTPMTLLEAMSSALPCVVSAVDGCAEVLGDGKGGATARPGDLEEFAEKLEPYLRSAELRRAQGAVAREKVVASFDARRQVARVEDLYRKLLARAR